MENCHQSEIKDFISRYEREINDTNIIQEKQTDVDYQLIKRQLKQARQSMKNPVHKKHKRMESQSNKEYYELTTDTLLKKDNYHPENMDRLASQPQKNHH